MWIIFLNGVSYIQLQGICILKYNWFFNVILELSTPEKKAISWIEPSLTLRLQQRWKFSSDQRISSFWTKYLEMKCFKLGPNSYKMRVFGHFIGGFLFFHQRTLTSLLQMSIPIYGQPLFATFHSVNGRSKAENMNESLI